MVIFNFISCVNVMYSVRVVNEDMNLLNCKLIQRQEIPDIDCDIIDVPSDGRITVIMVD